MADEEEEQFTSVKNRIAALKLKEGGKPPSVTAKNPSTNGVNSLQAQTTSRRQPPPPPPSAKPRVASANGHPINASPYLPKRSSAGAVSSRPLNAPPVNSTPPSRDDEVSTKVNGSVSHSSASLRAPALPQRPSLPSRGPSSSSLSSARGQSASGSAPAPAPPLPARRPSEQSVVGRRASVESTSSIRSARSSLSTPSISTVNTGLSEGSGRMLKVPVFDSSKAPSLPLSDLQESLGSENGDERGGSGTASRQATLLSSMVRSEEVRNGYSEQEDDDAPPPPLPSRPKSQGPRGVSDFTRSSTSISPVTRKLSAPAFAAGPVRSVSEQAPPLPRAPRPTSTAVQPAQPAYVSSATEADPFNCLHCRDFSAADAHAALYPREAVPNADLRWLAHELTAPFDSLTDKARVIFTWLHHNIAYNTHDYFNRTVKKATPASTFATGVAVCEGYAGLYTTLATHSGLESIVISGHGKGFGHKPLAANAPVPAYASNHAWTAVRLDDGRWKLMDATWGAGTISREEGYRKHFRPHLFTMANEEFGMHHFPTDRGYFFREDGAPGPSWEEYMLADAAAAERVTVYGVAAPQHGLRVASFVPATKHVRVRDRRVDELVRFQFEKACRHWDGERLGVGKPFVFVLQVGAKEYVPFESDGATGTYWCDVPAGVVEGKDGRVSVYAVKEFGGRSGRGLSVEEYLRGKGRVGMKFEGIAAWQVV